MRHAPLILAGLLAALSASPDARGQSAAGQNIAEDIGTWRLGCVVDRMTDRPSCELRHKDWVERPSGSPGLALEILWRDGRPVPAVTARNLSLDGAMRGVLALTGSAQIRFDTSPIAEMPCSLEGRSLICAPRAADAARLSEELSRARRVLIRMAGMGASGNEPAELPLSDTRTAADRMRAVAAPNPPPAAATPPVAPPVAPPPVAQPPAQQDGRTLDELMGRLRGLLR